MPYAIDRHLNPTIILPKNYTHINTVLPATKNRPGSSFPPDRFCTYYYRIPLSQHNSFCHHNIITEKP